MSFPARTLRRTNWATAHRLHGPWHGYGRPDRGDRRVRRRQRCLRTRPGAKILPIRLPKADEGSNQADTEALFNKAVAPAIRYAADTGAKVINISQGVTEGSPQLTAAVKYALDKGSLIFAGVGNDGDKANEVMYPAATPGVVGVAAVGKDLRRTAESEYGPQVDMAAPGEDIVAACGSETGLCRTHGTSNATALASASAALIWSVHPDWTNNQVLRVMLNTIGGPTDGAKRNDSIGYGIVRPRVALQNPGDQGPADVYPLPDLAAAEPKSPPPKPLEPPTRVLRPRTTTPPPRPARLPRTTEPSGQRWASVRPHSSQRPSRSPLSSAGAGHRQSHSRHPPPSQASSPPDSGVHAVSAHSSGGTGQRHPAGQGPGPN
ncbi:S8 family serine peptidase [Streptomyces sp. INA 01156]